MRAGYINVSMNEDDKNVKVHIKNSGIGIQKEELSKVFQRFTRLINHVDLTLKVQD